MESLHSAGETEMTENFQNLFLFLRSIILQKLYLKHNGLEED